MKLGIMQPYFFPYLGYWQLINAVDQYVIYDDVNFITRGWISRNNVLMNGTSKLINVRLHSASLNKRINEIEVVDDHIYYKKILRSIENNYSKAPCFSKAYPMIERVINQREKNLANYLEFGIRQVCDYLSINTEIIVSSSLKKDNELKGQDKVFEICKVLGADEYINAIGGQDLYSDEDFAAHGIRLSFLKTQEISYKQFENEFIPNLSIIDVLMFNEPQNIRKILDKYDVIPC